MAEKTYIYPELATAKRIADQLYRAGVIPHELVLSSSKTAPFKLTAMWHDKLLTYKQDFGHRDYDDYLILLRQSSDIANKHRDSYLARSTGITNSEGQATHLIFGSRNMLSVFILWDLMNVLDSSSKKE